MEIVISPQLVKKIVPAEISPVAVVGVVVGEVVLVDGVVFVDGGGVLVGGGVEVVGGGVEVVGQLGTSAILFGSEFANTSTPSLNPSPSVSWLSTEVP